MSSVTQLLLLMLCICHSAIARARLDDALKAEAVCAQPQVSQSSSSGATVRLSHGYGPCSPAPSTDEPTITELLHSDQLRANYVQRKFSAGKNGTEPSDLTVPTTLGSALGTLQYVITVGIGSPVVIQTMMVDTANDVSWVYCRSSNGSTLFDPSKSTTYAPFSCTAPECTQLGTRGNGCANSECQYNVDYAAVANSTGTYGSDTLTLTSSETVTSFQFGCRENEGAVAGKTDGIMGSSGFLTLGAPSDTSGFVSTPMFRWGAVPTFYGVLLQDIAVDGKLLNIPPSVFADRSVMSAGTIISRLPPAAYAALSTAFKAGMTQYTAAPPRSILDTCFDFTGLTSITMPNITLVFDGGVAVDLDGNGILIADCLAFAAATTPDGVPSIIGNVQQRTIEVLLDVGQSVVGFRPAAC
ncbi:aspartyl protease family protein At5g10770-like [Lolium rigidum]|uniref:aspartyl protease family protein At5g10770-like n=1 Tax=Lolium rigidum TaxID=89674 RepID=UPI001F5DE8E5|nr:aspartyl protease family protein At5g10770-like [Lolium rigidum]